MPVGISASDYQQRLASGSTNELGSVHWRGMSAATASGSAPAGAHAVGAGGHGFTSLAEGSPLGMLDLTTHLTTLIKTPRRDAELVIRGDEIPADPAAAADFCAEQDEALHERGFMRTSPWQELPSGDWTAVIEPACVATLSPDSALSADRHPGRLREAR